MLPSILSSFLPSCFHSGSNLHYGLMAPLGSSGSLPIFSPRHKEISSSPRVLTAYIWLESYKLLTPPAAVEIGAWWAEAERKNLRLLLQMKTPDAIGKLGPCVKGVPSWCNLTPLIFITEVTGYPGHFLKRTNLCSWLRQDFRMISPIKMDNPSALKWKIIMLCQSTLIPEKMDR